MNFRLKSLFISVFFLSSLSAFADIEKLGLEAGGVNPLDRKTEFINNYMIAFSEVKSNDAIRKFVAVIPYIGAKRVVIYEINPYTSALTKSVTLEGYLYSPFYLTFDPTGLQLYVLSSTKNMVTQYTFNPSSGKYELVKRNGDRKTDGRIFQIACDNNSSFSFDYARTLQIFPTEHKAYITCQDNKDQLSITQYQFEDKTGALINPKPLFDKQTVRKEWSNPGLVLISPFGKYVYVVDGKNTWHKYVLENGYLKLTNESLTTDVSKIVSATFDPAGKNVYVVAYDRKGYSLIVQYRFDGSSGTLAEINTTHVPDVNDHTSAQAVYLQFGPKGRYAYAFDRKSNVIYQYRVNAETGKLEALNPAMLITCSVVRSLVFDPNLSTPHAYAAASNRADVKLVPKNPKLCQKMISNPYELRIDQFLMDPATGQLTSFISKP